MTARIASALVGALLAATAMVPPALAEKVIRIGVLQPLSGPQATYGRETQPVVEYMVRKINEEGGIKSMGGAKLELVTADTAGKSAQAAQEALRLIAEEKVDVIVGALITSDMLAATRPIDEAKVPTISFFAGGSQTRYAYSVGFSYDDGYSGSLADFVGHLKRNTDIPAKRVTLAYANYEGGQQINKYLKARLLADGAEIVSEIALDVKATDFTATLIKIRADKPDIVIGLMLQNQVIGLQQARYQMKYYDSAFVSTLAQSDTRLKRDLGPDVAREVLPHGVYGMALYSPTAKLESVRLLADELIGKAGMGDHFGQLSIPAAQGMRVLQRALEAAGTTDKEAVTAAIGKVTIPAGAPDLYFPLPEGLAFGEDRLIKHLRSMITQWTADADPTAVVVYPESIASVKPRR